MGTPRGLQQNGSGAQGQWPNYKAMVHNCSHGIPSTSSPKTKLHSKSSSGTSSPSQKAQPNKSHWRDSPARPQPDPEMEVSGPHNPDTAHDALEGDPMVDFPISDKPISDMMLKDMLLSLRSFLHADMIKGINKCTREVQALGHRVDHMEKKMDEYTSSYNIRVEAHSTG